MIDAAVRLDSFCVLCTCGAGRFHPPCIGPIEGRALEFWAQHHSGEGHAPASSYIAWRIKRDGYYAGTAHGSDYRGVDWRNAAGRAGGEKDGGTAK